MSQISAVRKQFERHNPVSGHRWTEYGEIIGYEVYGNKWSTQRFKKCENALREKQERDAFDKKYQNKL